MQCKKNTHPHTRNSSDNITYIILYPNVLVCYSQHAVTHHGKVRIDVLDGQGLLHPGPESEINGFP